MRVNQEIRSNMMLFYRVDINITDSPLASNPFYELTIDFIERRSIQPYAGMIEWCRVTFKKYSYAIIVKSNHISFRFKHEDDMLLFKLKYNGNSYSAV